jgi:general secretion pathway protein G
MQGICRRTPASCRGFTLVELLVVMLVLGVLAMLAMPLAEVTVQRDRERELKHALWTIRDALDAHKRAADAGEIVRAEGTSGYPATLEVLVTGVPSLKEPGRNLYFLRRVPRDPFAESTAGVAGWGLRSFQSPPDRPQPGADVYDVFSKSERVGLNGIALKDW